MSWRPSRGRRSGPRVGVSPPVPAELEQRDPQPPLSHSGPVYWEEPMPHLRPHPSRSSVLSPTGDQENFYQAQMFIWETAFSVPTWPSVALHHFSPVFLALFLLWVFQMVSLDCGVSFEIAPRDQPDADPHLSPLWLCWPPKSSHWAVQAKPAGNKGFPCPPSSKPLPSSLSPICGKFPVSTSPISDVRGPDAGCLVYLKE